MEHKHSTGKRLLALLLFIITLPFVLLGLLVFGLIYIVTTVLPSPIERLIYKKSLFYKDLGVPYMMGITKSFAYKSYKYVRHNSGLELVYQDEGYYYYKRDNTVLVLPYYAGYYFENGKWMLTMDEGKKFTEITYAKDVFAPLIKEDISNLELKLLVKEKSFAKENLKLAKTDPVFVFYKNHKDFINI